MKLNLSVIGDDTDCLVEHLKKELNKQNIVFEVQNVENNIGVGYLSSPDFIIEILKIALGPGLLAIICKIVISLKSNVKITIGENSFEVSSYMSKKEKKILVDQFIKKTDVIEKSDKIVNGSIAFQNK